VARGKKGVVVNKGGVGLSLEKRRAVPLRGIAETNDSITFAAVRARAPVLVGDRIDLLTVKRPKGGAARPASRGAFLIPGVSPVLFEGINLCAARGGEESGEV